MSKQSFADLLNLGPKSAKMLQDAGIQSVEELRKLGAVEAYLVIKQHEIPVSLNMLYAMHGALINTHWNKLDKAIREALIMEVDAIESQQ